MAWISNDKHKTEEKSIKSSRSSSKVVGLGLADLWEFPTLHRSTKTDDIDGLVQERRNSSALAMELRLSCTNPLI